MSLVNFIFKRSISTTATLNGKRNFRKFPLYGKRGTRAFKLQHHEDPYTDIPVYDRGVKPTGQIIGDKFVQIPEMIPSIIVPDLTDCKFKPYVSYRARDVTQSPFTAKDLFNVVYARKIIEDFKTSKLDENGQPLEPSDEEKMTADEAMIKARQTGSDIF